MGDMTKEPSMEEMYSHMKGNIAAEADEPGHAAPGRGCREGPAKEHIQFGAPVARMATPVVEEILELTEAVAVEDLMSAPKPAPKATATVRPVESDAEAETILSVESEVAARHSLSALSSMMVTPKEGEDNTLDGLVRTMLKPMLKEWLDARLPALVEDMVAKEIARITSR